VTIAIGLALHQGGFRIAAPVDSDATDGNQWSMPSLRTPADHARSAARAKRRAAHTAERLELYLTELHKKPPAPSLTRRTTGQRPTVLDRPGSESSNEPLQRLPLELNDSVTRHCMESAAGSSLAHFPFAERDTTSAENALARTGGSTEFSASPSPSPELNGARPRLLVLVTSNRQARTPRG
jgi:hypothetical protein